MVASESAREKIKAEILTSEKGEKFIFPFADGTAKLCGRDDDVRESTLRLYHLPGSGDFQREFQGNSDGSQPTKAHDDAEARNDPWSMEGDLFIGPTHETHLEP